MPEGPALSLPRSTDLEQIEPYQYEALASLLNRPRHYVQRLTERMSFVDNGQRWRRDIQLRIPELYDKSSDLESRPYVVSLGMFTRRRFPDFSVTNGAGRECALVTRRQHGHMLAFCMMFGLLRPAEWGRVYGSRTARQQLNRLNNGIATMFTTIPVSTEFTADAAVEQMKELFAAIGIKDSARLTRAEELLRHSCSVIKGQTQYLCWVWAKPGDIVRLSATYTTTDVPVVDAHTFEESDLVTPEWRLWWRNRRMRAYAHYRMLPLHYQVPAPANDHCSSYYYTIDPPDEARVGLLEWGHGRRLQPEHGNASTQADEVDSATMTCHIHNGERPAIADEGSAGYRPTEIHGARLHAFIRPESFDHNKLSAIGILSVALAWLAQNGSFVTTARGIGTQWLLVTPAAMLVFIGQQQRHHSGPFTRAFRVTMWFYIAASVIFAGVEALSMNGAAGRALGNGTGNDIISGGFALFSAAVAILFFATGRRFDGVVERRFIRTLGRVRDFGTPSRMEATLRFRRRPAADGTADDGVWFRDRDGVHPADRIFLAVARHYIDRTLIYVAIGCVVGAMAMVSFGWGESRRAAVKQQRATASRQVKTPTTTTPAATTPAARP